MACQQASGQETPEDIDDDDIFQLSGIQMEVDGERRATGTFRSKRRPTEILRPGGDWPQHWGDYTHEQDGHGLEAGPGDRTGQEILNGLIMSLYIQNGVEMACDDVSGAALDPSMVHTARKTEMDYFKGMVV